MLVLLQEVEGVLYSGFEGAKVTVLYSTVLISIYSQEYVWIFWRELRQVSSSEPGNQKP